MIAPARADVAPISATLTANSTAAARPLPQPSSRRYPPSNPESASAVQASGSQCGGGDGQRRPVEVDVTGGPHNVAFDPATIPPDVRGQLDANMGTDKMGELSSALKTNAGESVTISFANIKATGANTVRVVLSGGVFQNALLLLAKRPASGRAADS